MSDANTNVMSTVNKSMGGARSKKHFFSSFPFITTLAHLNSIRFGYIYKIRSVPKISELPYYNV